MATLNARRLRVFASALQSLSAPVSNAAGVTFDKTVTPGNSTTDGDWDLAVVQEYSIGASSNTDVDLQSIADAEGTTVSFAEINLLVIEADADNGDVIRLTQGASNGWTAWIAGTAPQVDLSAGGFEVVYRGGAGLAVGASDKVLNLANQDSGAAATVRVYIYGRSA